MRSPHIFIDQVLTGFNLNTEDYGVGDFLAKRQAIINDPQQLYVLEFVEIAVDTYENLPYHRKGQLDPSLRNVLIWRNAREPYSLTYWSLAEFARLLQLLHDGGVDRIMVRTFLTYTGRIGHGRFLRQEHTPHTEAFEWRRADEFCRRHPEVRKSESKLLNWDAELREDSIYNIPQGMTVGTWFQRQLFDFFQDLGVDAVRFGDGSYGGTDAHHKTLNEEAATCIHKELYHSCQERDIKMLTSLGPYWSFDAWHNNLGVNFADLPDISDWVLTQPLEGWTDKYGVMHIHNGEYFNAGCGLLHSLINNALYPQTHFIRGLDSGDIIENWQPREGMPLRQTFDSLSLSSRSGNDYIPAYQGIYHFWSDELSSDYYHQQQVMQTYVQEHPAQKVHGPELLVTTGQRPGSYILGDFFEGCGYGMRVSINCNDIIYEAGQTYVLFLPRIAGNEAVHGEEAMSPAEAAAYEKLLDSPANVIVFGGARDEKFLESFSLQYTGTSIDPVRWQHSDTDTGAEWYDHAAASAHENMAGRPEEFQRKDYLHFECAAAETLVSALDSQGNKRPLVTRQVNQAGGQRIYVGGIPEDAARSVAGDIIADLCNLSHRVNCDVDVSSHAWTDKNGGEHLAIIRYGAWHEASATIQVSDLDSYSPDLAYGCSIEDNELHMLVQSYMLFSKK
ncbi:MAG: hypothetical protein HRU15_07790 [Planctomycetes bacterium]|nr:hypothetical protein [Planctomycetota bacterium]